MISLGGPGISGPSRLPEALCSLEGDGFFEFKGPGAAREGPFEA